MANHSADSVKFVDTTATISDAKRIVGIKYLGEAASSVTLKSKNSSGSNVWEEDGTADVFEDVNIKCSEGVHVVIVGTARVYIYLA